MRVLPDAEGLVIGALAAALNPVPVWAERPPDAEGRLPFVLVQRLPTGGSVGQWFALDAALMSVEAWAQGRRAAMDLAESARVALHQTAIPPACVLPGGVLSSVRDVSAPFIAPELGETAGLRRASFTAYCFLRPSR